MRKRRKIWIAEAKFDKFCKRKFDKRRILFCAVFVDYICVYFLRSWMFTIIVDISVTFLNLGFYDKSKPCIAIRPVIISKWFFSGLTTLCTSGPKVFFYFVSSVLYRCPIFCTSGPLFTRRKLANGVFAMQILSHKCVTC